MKIEPTGCFCTASPWPGSEIWCRLQRVRSFWTRTFTAPQCFRPGLSFAYGHVSFFFSKTIISWTEDRWLLCFEWTFGSIWWLHVVHVVEQSCACRGRIFRWCHHAAFGTRWFRSIQKGSVTVAAGFASEMLVEICLRCLHRVRFLWKNPKDPEIQIQWPNHRSSKQSLKLVVGSSTGSY
jgi:hypothetical protein